MNNKLSISFIYLINNNQVYLYYDWVGLGFGVGVDGQGLPGLCGCPQPQFGYPPWFGFPPGPHQKVSDCEAAKTSPSEQ